MKRFLFIFLGLCLALGASAQKGHFTEQGDNDPNAHAALKKLKAKYDRFKSIELDYTLTIEIPENDKQVLKGKMVQTGDKYRVDMGDYLVICNGESVWTVMKDAEEVQVMDAEDGIEAEGLMSPKDLLQIYESGDYLYAMLPEIYEKGTLVQQIEFKPHDRDSEYTKMRLTVDKKAQLIKRIKIFSRDGSRYTLTLGKIRPNRIYDSKFFRYQDNICPGCPVEDLRF
jgi:outer membrane lipoprotein-sorting protein